jgi:hypothetical protein
MNKKVLTPTPIDQRPSDNPYPTDTELRIIRQWDILKYTIPGLVEYVRTLWHYPDRGFHLRKGRRILFHDACMKLELHTAGWSGNEEVIEALQRNFLFWGLCWERETRGGHYYFEIRMADWNRNLTKEQYAEMIAKTDRITKKALGAKVEAVETLSAEGCKAEPRA